VVTGNDANLGALAEHVRGAAVGFADVAYLSASVGIGGGFLVDGRPLTGAAGYAGEVGHMPVDNDGAVCRCGAVGCWETKVGENVLLRGAGRLPGGGPPAVAEVIAAAQAGDARAAAAVAEVAEWSGVGIRAVVNLFNPQVVVLGGALAQVWRAAEDRVQAAIARSNMTSPREDVVIRPARLEDDAPMIGAAELDFAPVLEFPQEVAQGA
jgi:predicted NBD/HSP70 family sugar kinase